jgi:hypothetical protein
MKFMPDPMQKLRMPIQPLERLSHGGLQRCNGMSLWYVLLSEHMTHLMAQSTQAL